MIPLAGFECEFGIDPDAARAAIFPVFIRLGQLAEDAEQVYAQLQSLRESLFGCEAETMMDPGSFRAAPEYLRYVELAAEFDRRVSHFLEVALLVTNIGVRLSLVDMSLNLIARVRQVKAPLELVA